MLATRYVPEYGVFANLDVVPRGDPLLLETPAVASEYAVGRDLGEEYRCCILERQLAKSYPGNCWHGRRRCSVHGRCRARRPACKRRRTA
ncbi:MAG: hypothetical protein U1E76_20940 [Planctomycetota bacterium]